MEQKLLKKFESDEDEHFLDEIQSGDREESDKSSQSIGNGSVNRSEQIINESF